MKKVSLIAFGLLVGVLSVEAQNRDNIVEHLAAGGNDVAVGVDTSKVSFFNRFTIGGYGEATYAYNMYSDNPYRYMYPNRYKNAQGFGRMDLPHVVIMLGYDFGRGWHMGSEIEFEHGGTEVAIDVEGDEAVELEHEVERGGEVYLEQFWLEKTFLPQLNVRAGMLIVPVGLTNEHHLPTEFFTVFRPEGERTILPCTWHQIGLSLWGRAGRWRYEAMLLPGLNSRFFNNSGWIHKGASSPYEFTVANQLAVAVRANYRPMDALCIGLSGYYGGTRNDAYPQQTNNRITNNGNLTIASFDFVYKGHHAVARGNMVYGHLDNAAGIGSSNKNSDNSTFSPYSHTFVGKNAYAAGVEVGLDCFSWSVCSKLRQQRLFLFGRYEYYDSYVPSAGQPDYKWSDRQILAVGLNYFPIQNIVIKAEYNYRLLRSQYNDEPSLNIGIAYAGLFTRKL